MLLVASGVDVIIDEEEVASGFKNCERMNGFKSWIRKVKFNDKKAWCKLCRCEVKIGRAHV